jgi:hypothetical protein
MCHPNQRNLIVNGPVRFMYSVSFDGSRCFISNIDSLVWGKTHKLQYIDEKLAYPDAAKIVESLYNGVGNRYWVTGEHGEDINLLFKEFHNYITDWRESRVEKTFESAKKIFNYYMGESGNENVVGNSRLIEMSSKTSSTLCSQSTRGWIEDKVMAIVGMACGPVLPIEFESTSMKWDNIKWDNSDFIVWNGHAKARGSYYTMDGSVLKPAEHVYSGMRHYVY